MVWDAQTPYRVGAPTILKCIDCILSALADYGSTIKAHTDSSVHTHIDALQVACEAFKTNIPHPREGFDL